MAVLRSGKITRVNTQTRNRNRNAHKYRLKEFNIEVKRLSENEIRLLSRPKKYNLRFRVEKIATNTRDNPLQLSNTGEKNVENQMQRVPTHLKTIATSKIIWNELSNRHYEFHPTELVLARMNTFRPWPAKINSVYKVGNVFKCCVLFFGTYQLGSVLKSECVKFNDSHLYLLHSVREIKQKFKWNLDYEQLSKTGEKDRICALSKLTQVLKFFLSIRDIEQTQNIPYEHSIIQRS